MKKLLYQFLGLSLLLGLGLYASGCVSAYGFQTGRAMGKGAGEVVLDVSFVGIESEGAVIGSPTGGLAGRVGVSDKADVGVVLSTTSLPYLYGRYQVVGDQYSPVALSVGVGGGYVTGNVFGSNVGGGYLHFPAYFSLHSGDFAWYLTPQYTLLLAGSNGSTGSASVISLSTGIEYMVGRHVGLGVNGSVTKAPDAFDAFSTFNVGLGLKFRFGN